MIASSHHRPSPKFARHTSPFASSTTQEDSIPPTKPFSDRLRVRDAGCSLYQSFILLLLLYQAGWQCIHYFRSPGGGLLTIGLPLPVFNNSECELQLIILRRTYLREPQ